jgi:transposase
MPKTPEILEVNPTQLEDLLRRVEEALDANDATLIRKLLQSYLYVTDLVEDKKTSIRLLRELLFGKSTEKTAAVVGRGSDATEAAPPGGAAAQTQTGAGQPESGEAKPPHQEASTQTLPARAGHGRNGAAAYRGAERIEVPHASLKPGQPCPACQDGTLYEKCPGVVVRIVGQPPLQAKIYELQKLRCHLCGEVFTAEAPAEAGEQKYLATAGSMIGLLKYGSGLPFNRLAGLQGHLEVPLPASTQWDVVAAAARLLTPSFEELIRQAARGEVLHNDDTTIKILALMGEPGRQDALAGGAEEGDKAEQRSGLFTSGVVALADGYRVALFFSGRRHAGENLAEVLAHRAAELPAPIQMCDALSRNLPGELRTIVAHCLAHARRNFVDLYERFPEPCGHLLEALRVVYHNDARARADKLTPEGRLQFHQQHSQPVLQQLHDWLKRQFDDKLVEPNSALGGAIRYMLKHWDKLTLFQRRAGAPLDNNVCERALKKAILHRKNALFYQTANGARVGDLFMSLIYTCELNEANPFDYLTELQQHSDQLAAKPERWMPWNYRATLLEESSQAKQ